MKRAHQDLTKLRLDGELYKNVSRQNRHQCRPSAETFGFGVPRLISLYITEGKSDHRLPHAINLLIFAFMASKRTRRPNVASPHSISCLWLK